ncbi:hypothetical protein Efla_005942 [Eimeria flavescens]
MADGPQMRRRYAEPQGGSSSGLQQARRPPATAAAPGAAAVAFDPAQQQHEQHVQQTPLQQQQQQQQLRGPYAGAALSGPPPQQQQQPYQQLQQQPYHQQQLQQQPQQQLQQQYQQQQEQPSGWGSARPAASGSGSSGQGMQQQPLQQPQREVHGQQQAGFGVYAPPQQSYRQQQLEGYHHEQQPQQQSYYGGPGMSMGGPMGAPYRARGTPVRPPVGPLEGEDAGGNMQPFGGSMEGPYRQGHLKGGGPPHRAGGQASAEAAPAGFGGSSAMMRPHQGAPTGALGGPMGRQMGVPSSWPPAGVPPMGAPPEGQLRAAMDGSAGALSGTMQHMQQQGPPPPARGLSLIGGLLALFSSQQPPEGAPSAAAAAAATAAPSDSEDLFENEPPLLEDLGINPQDIWKRTKAVLLFNKADHDLLAECDLCGPLMVSLLLAFILFLAGKASFGCLYGMSIIGSLSAYLLLNLMSRADGIDLYRTASILGYSLLPVVLVAVFILLLERQGFLVRLAFAALGVGWATRTASSFFEAALRLQEQRLLVAYPILLLYASFTILTLF